MKTAALKEHSKIFDRAAYLFIVLSMIFGLITYRVYAQNNTVSLDKITIIKNSESPKTLNIAGTNKANPDYSSLKKATILDLSNYGLNEIPSDVFNLINLETLILKNNNITEIPADIRKLYCLKMLDLTNTNIQELPDEISQLNQLKEIHLSYEIWQYRVDKVRKITRAAIILE